MTLLINTAPRTVVTPIPDTLVDFDIKPYSKVLKSADGFEYSTLIGSVVRAIKNDHPAEIYKYPIGENGERDQLGIMVFNPDMVYRVKDEDQSESNVVMAYYYDISGHTTFEELDEGLLTTVRELFDLDPNLLTTADQHAYKAADSNVDLRRTALQVRCNTSDSLTKAIATLFYIEAEYYRYSVHKQEQINKPVSKVWRDWIDSHHGIQPNLSCNAEYSGFSPDGIALDSTFQRHVLLELLGNSLKYLGEYNEQPEINVYLDKGQDNSFTLTVADNGVGMSTSDLKNLCRDGYRSPRTRDIPGSGYGVSLILDEVHRMGGEVCVASSTGDTDQLNAVILSNLDNCENILLDEQRVSELVKDLTDKGINIPNSGSIFRIHLPKFSDVMREAIPSQSNPEEP